MSDIYSIPVTTKNGEQTTLEAYRGKTLLIVNTASACGFTPQFEGLKPCTRPIRIRAWKSSAFPATSSAARIPQPGRNRKLLQG